MTAPLGWGAIVRLGLVQSALGAVVMLATSLLNRVMVVEYALPAMIPAGLVAWHYAVQLSRPRWGHASDQGMRRTPWIVGGMGVLAMGGLVATNSALMIAAMPMLGMALGIVGFTMIGAGVGAAGTSLLALLATQVAPSRRPAAAAITWVMMIAGIVVTAGIAGSLLDPFSPARLATVAGGVVLAAFCLTLAAVWKVETRGPASEERPAIDPQAFGVAVRETWAEPRARHFTIFVFVSMLAYSAQDMILEPFAGLVFGYTPGESTSLSSLQHMGVLLGMILVGVGGNAFGGRARWGLRRWIVGGTIGSAGALAGLAVGAGVGPGWPLGPSVFLLGLFNGIFAVAAIAAMMELAGAGGGGSREGVRMGVWGAAQAIAFGLGNFAGAAGFDAGRALTGSAPLAFTIVFAAEAGLFLVAALLALRMQGTAADPRERSEPKLTLAGARA